MRMISTYNITLLIYITLLSENIDQAQELLSNAESQALKIGLKINLLCKINFNFNNK